MSITSETVQVHGKEPAVLCCRTEAGTVLSPANLEDPTIFPDLEESGLLQIPQDSLSIEQVLGATLTVTSDSLVPLTPRLVEGFSNLEVEASTKIIKEQTPNFIAQEGQQVVKIHIAKGENIALEIPLALMHNEEHKPLFKQEPSEERADKEAVELHRVQQQHFKIEKVVFGEITKIDGTTLFLRQPQAKEYNATPESNGLVEGLEVDIITPDKYGAYSDTIMDVQPIATKVEGEVGAGITRVLDGVIFMVTGVDHDGVQVGEFGSCEGAMDRNIMWNRPGAPDKGEIFIKTRVVIKAKANMERPGPLAVHKVSDLLCQEIRLALKDADSSLVTATKELVHYRRPGKPKILIVKEIMGQGAMHDNLILPVEPVGTLGGKPNVDLGNLPILLAPTELLDGGIHALTCIGPASKETSRHYWREPLVRRAMEDEELDLAGVLLVGSPQANSDKFYVAKRVGMLVEAMDIAGAIVTTEGFGNNHVDFAAHIEEIGKRGVKVVGASYCAVQGTLVVGNKYMEAMCDNNKSLQGIENEILSNNTLCPEDAIRQIAMLKTLLGGGTIEPAARKWDKQIKLNNLAVIEKQLGVKIPLEDNEQSIPKSKKRLEKYEKEEA